MEANLTCRGAILSFQPHSCPIGPGFCLVSYSGCVPGGCRGSRALGLCRFSLLHSFSRSLASSVSGCRGPRAFGGSTCRGSAWFLAHLLLPWLSSTGAFASFLSFRWSTWNVLRRQLEGTSACTRFCWQERSRWTSRCWVICAYLMLLLSLASFSLFALEFSLAATRSEV